MGICAYWNLDCTKKFRKESKNETDISAKEKTENERTWFQKENGNQERKKRFEEKESQRQKEIDCLISENQTVNQNAEKECFKEKK